MRRLACPVDRLFFALNSAVSTVLQNYESITIGRKREQELRRILTSESVTEGHPDKVCDQISDAILDAILEKDPDAHVACETFASTGAVFVMGEITTEAYVDIQKIARNTIREIGYTGSDMGFDADTCAVITLINEQSPDIAVGVNNSYEHRLGGEDINDSVGAGDQGIVFGYATDETESLMPMPIYLAHLLAKRLATVRKEDIVKNLRPDGKSQVSVEYEDGKPVRVHSILISAQHNPDADYSDMKEQIWKEVIQAVIPMRLIDSETAFYFNPTGIFEMGGPQADTGLTGRKIIVDTFGGVGHHGGGAFSGKDPTKVDRSGSYYARYVAKNLVAAGLCQRCEISVAYAIGVARPFSINLDTFGTGVASEEKLLEIINKVFDFRPNALITSLDLRRPIYKKTAAYGHFGRDDLDLPWEKLGQVDALRREYEANQRQ